MVEITKTDKKIYNIFHYLRENLPLVSATSLRHLSTYLEKTNEEFDPSKDIMISTSESENVLYELYLTNGTKIVFYNYPSKELNFSVEKTNDNVNSYIHVSNLDNNLDSAYVHAEINYNNCRFVMGINGDNKTGFIESYQTNKKVIISTSYFKIEEDPYNSLDIFDGLGYITVMMLRAELLYNNLTKLSEFKLVRTK